MLELIVVQGVDEGKSFLAKDVYELRIGAGAEKAGYWNLSDPSLAALEAVIRMEGLRYVLRGTPNADLIGVWRKHLRLSLHSARDYIELQRDDFICLGKTRIQVLAARVPVFFNVVNTDGDQKLTLLGAPLSIEPAQSPPPAVPPEILSELFKYSAEVPRCQTVDEVMAHTLKGIFRLFPGTSRLLFPPIN